MNITHLLYFVTAAESGSITKAADILNLSQPAVSLGIKSLESELGVMLLERKNNVISLTERGRYLVEIGKPLLKNISAVEKEAASLSESEFILEIATPPMVGTVLLPHICNGFAKAHPNIHLRFIEEGTAITIKKTLANEVNLGMVLYDENTPYADRLNYVYVQDTEIVYVIRKGHPLANRIDITYEEIVRYPVMMMNEGTFTEKLIMAEFMKKGLNPRVLLNSNQISIMLSILKEGEAGAFLIKDVATKFEDVIALPLQEPIKLKMGFVYKKGRHRTSEERLLFHYFRDHMANKR